MLATWAPHRRYKCRTPPPKIKRHHPRTGYGSCCNTSLWRWWRQGSCFRTAHEVERKTEIPSKAESEGTSASARWRSIAVYAYALLCTNLHRTLSPLVSCMCCQGSQLEAAHSSVVLSGPPPPRVEAFRIYLQLSQDIFDFQVHRLAPPLRRPLASSVVVAQTQSYPLQTRLVGKWSRRFGVGTSGPRPCAVVRSSPRTGRATRRWATWSTRSPRRPTP